MLVTTAGQKSFNRKIRGKLVMAFVTTSSVVRSTRSGETMIGKLTAAYGRYRLYSRTLTELSQLNDRELADLGLTRTSIASVAHEAAYGQ